MIGIGDPAPDFELPSGNGAMVRLSALRPRRVVVFFYPKDDTPACTEETCAFSASRPAFDAHDVALLGISKDSPTRHRNFAGKYGIDVTLLSDAGTGVCEAWGVWQTKQTFGRSYMGIARSTFLIDGTGLVARVWSPVRVPGHVPEVLAAIG